MERDYNRWGEVLRGRGNEEEVKKREERLYRRERFVERGGERI